MAEEHLNILSLSNTRWKKPAESKPQTLQTMMDWWALSLLLLSFITESDWGSNTDEIWKCCAQPGIGLLALALSVVSYFLYNWVSGLKSGITLSTQNIASSYKSCVHLREAPCPFFCITDGDNIFLWSTGRGRQGKEKHKFPSTKWIILQIQTSKLHLSVCQSIPQTFFPTYISAWPELS